MEKQYTGFWGTGEGVVSIRRTGIALAAGRVITIRASSAGVVTVLAPDANWTITNINGSLNFESGGIGSSSFWQVVRHLSRTAVQIKELSTIAHCCMVSTPRMFGPV
ncbi:MAG: hypothetical protein IPP33_02055 [Flavobacteriales bacterium]|nr:hypothetical protein [Flavobacteriales bacterium]